MLFCDHVVSLEDFKILASSNSEFHLKTKESILISHDKPELNRNEKSLPLPRANHVPYMTKALRKAIMKWSELKSKYVKNKASENLKSYRKQRNFCSKLYKKERMSLITRNSGKL